MYEARGEFAKKKSTKPKKQTEKMRIRPREMKYRTKSGK